MGNTGKALGNTVAGVARISVGDTKGAKRSMKRAGKSYKKAGKQIGNTAADLGKSVANTSAGIANGTAGIVTNNKKLKKRAKRQFKKAGRQAINATLGKADITETVNLNVAQPYNMTVSSVQTKGNVRSGAAGMILIEPIDMIFKKELNSLVNSLVKTEINGLIEKFRIKLKHLTFVKDEEINKFIRQVWEPQNISCKFNNRNEMCLSLNNTFVTWIIQQVNSLNLGPIPAQSINLNLEHHGHVYTVKITLDFNASNVYCTLYGVDKLVAEAESLLRAALINKIGKKTCYRCRTSINPQNANVTATATIYVQVPL